MALKRFLLIVAFVLAASVVLVPGAAAGDFDPPAMGCTGDDPATCHAGRVGVPYSQSVRLVGDQDTGCAVLRVSAGGLPPGLSITQQFNETNAAIIGGTPTAAGNFSFYLTVDYNASPGCAKSSSDNQFIIPINPEIPRLVLQPEQSAVPISTVGAPFSLQMTSSLPDAQTWSVSGELPPGLSLGPTNGLISGTPTTAGTYSFTVSSVLTSDPLVSPPRSDSKALQIVVRSAVVITAGEPFGAGVTRWEVGVPFAATLTAAGGNESYTWALGAGTLLPAGLVLGTTDGTISGTPRVAGLTRLTVTATDGEGRVATYRAVLNVAAKLAIVRQALPAGQGRQALQGEAQDTWRSSAGLLARHDRTAAARYPFRSHARRARREADEGRSVSHYRRRRRTSSA